MFRLNETFRGFLHVPKFSQTDPPFEEEVSGNISASRIVPTSAIVQPGATPMTGIPGSLWFFMLAHWMGGGLHWRLVDRLSLPVFFFHFGTAKRMGRNSPRSQQSDRRSPPLVNK